MRETLSTASTGPTEKPHRARGGPKPPAPARSRSQAKARRPAPGKPGATRPPSARLNRFPSIIPNKRTALPRAR
ncbi:hypothetical protein CE91St30_17370 [Raoultibacter timonensis]|uniref:Uncharacterized protein n=1 Tax=Raoultibacter timonensis TaxID=1907662 RepID=A0ABM7WJA9_9ACTN|nr:hypothetical protein CE91St30_17370 [Raoultibacter timonensis]BDF51008.1 hypothetical protein CE91St31_17380 [Raoultibacter timonensis]